MAGRQYKAGVKPMYSEGKMSEQRIAWVETHIGQFMVMRYREGDPEPETNKAQPEPGPTIRLMHPKSGRPIMWNLTALTLEELTALRELLNLALDLAEPVVKLRDEAANDAWKHGDDSFVRLYRRSPQLVRRPGVFGEDGKSLLDGPDDVPQGHDGDGDSALGVPSVGPGLAEREPQDPGTQDDDQAED